MSSYVTLEEAKAHLGIDEGLSIHDGTLQRIINAAELAIANYCNVPLAQLAESNSQLLSSPFDTGTLHYGTLPEDLKSSILLEIEIQFDRNVDDFQMLEKRRDSLANPYRKLLGV